MSEQVKYGTATIAEMTNGIILANFEKRHAVGETTYQSEAELERSMIENLVCQGYERFFVKSQDDLYINLKKQIERLNQISFTSQEWKRFLLEYLDAPNDSMIENLVSQRYERFFVKSQDDLYINLKKQIERLNQISFTSQEWKRFLLEYLDAPNDSMIEKTRKIQENHIYDFIFDDGHLKNIKIIDKENIHNN